MVASEEAVKEHNLTPLARCDLHLGVTFVHPNVGQFICTVRSKTKSCFEDLRSKSIIMVKKRPFEKNED